METETEQPETINQTERELQIQTNIELAAELQEEAQIVSVKSLIYFIMWNIFVITTHIVIITLNYNSECRTNTKLVSWLIVLTVKQFLANLPSRPLSFVWERYPGYISWSFYHKYQQFISFLSFFGFY